MDGKIVEFTEALLDGCAELYVDVFTAAPWNEPWTMELARPRLADMLAMPRSLGFVWVEGRSRRPVGLALGRVSYWVGGLEFYLNELCVHPDRQGHGIGSRLLRHLEQTVAAMGVHSVYLQTEVDTPAAAFYAKHGYETHHDTISMSRKLP